MKNKLKKFFVLLLVVMMPLTFVLTACGATPTSEVRGVHFVSNKYDEATGYAIFEVDKDVPTKLEYKVNPSTWSGYEVTYTTPEDSAENKVRYTLINGVILVSETNFHQIQVKIHINGQTDSCYVRLKVYPDRIYTDQSSVKLNARGVYTICPIGEFTEGANKVSRPINDNEYNFLVESNDSTIIRVVNPSRLMVCSDRKNTATAKVTVTLCNTKGKSKGMSFVVDFTVIQNAREGYLLADGYDKFIKNGDEITVDLSTLETDGGGNKVLKYDLFVASDSNLFIETTSLCTTSTTKYIDVNDELGQLEIHLGSGVTSLTSTVNIWTPLVDEEGNSCALIFKLNIRT